MGIDFYGGKNTNKKRFSFRNKVIKPPTAAPLTRNDLLFLQSIGLKVKKGQWRRLKN